MAVSLKQHKDLLYSTLEKHKHIFQSGTPYISHSETRNNILRLFIPRTLDMNSGQNLKDGGFIRCDETFNVEDEDDIKRVSYSYTCTCDLFTYSCNSGTDQKLLPFHFRFEKIPEETPSHPEYHLQVIHDMPRYPSSNSLSLGIFLDIVEMTFFNNKERHQTSPWML